VQTRDTQGAGTGPAADLPTLKLTKPNDKTTQYIFDAAATGRIFRSALLDIADPDTDLPTFRYQLKDVNIAIFRYQFRDAANSAASTEPPIDVFALSFADFQINYNLVPDNTEEVMNLTVTSTRSKNGTRPRSRSNPSRRAPASR
jgi:type VI protein secretion system component Hcp